MHLTVLDNMAWTTRYQKARPALVRFISLPTRCRVPPLITFIGTSHDRATCSSLVIFMSPTLVPTPPIATPPLGAFASYRTTTSAHVGCPAEGLRHADNIVLDARWVNKKNFICLFLFLFALRVRQYKTTGFAQDVLRLLSTLRIASWSASPGLTPASLKIHKVSGSLTNAVFFISHTAAKTVLLRVYGPSSSSLISRPHELHTLHVLSSCYGIGPRVYGTFANGRVEQYFESEALTPREMRDPQVSAWIGMRMAELHCVDLRRATGETDGGELENVRRAVRSWLGPAREVVRLAQARGHPRAAVLQLERFAEEWEEYWAWLMRWERTHGRSERVFAHNDAQYGNLLQMTTPRGREPAHHKVRAYAPAAADADGVQIIVVDFEYAGPNAAAYDIANHFHEWMADYHAARPHELERARYPDVRARRNFYVAYLTQRHSAANMSSSSSTVLPTDAEVDALDAAVQAWSPASHGMWAVWGIVQAREEVAGGGGGEFDYLEYAASRMVLFRASL